MTWPATAVATGDLITATQLNGLPVKLGDVTEDGTPGSLTFSSIPSVYAHLLISVYGRSARASLTSDGIYVRFNGDTGANYTDNLLSAVNTTVASAGVAAHNSGQVGKIPSVDATAGIFGSMLILVPNYADTNGLKTAVAIAHWATALSAAGESLGLGGTTWNSSAAISTVALSVGATGFAQYSRATLYGMP